MTTKFSFFRLNGFLVILAFVGGFGFKPAEMAEEPPTIQESRTLLLRSATSSTLAVPPNFRERVKSVFSRIEKKTTTILVKVDKIVGCKVCAGSGERGRIRDEQGQFWKCLKCDGGSAPRLNDKSSFD